MVLKAINRSIKYIILFIVFSCCENTQKAKNNLEINNQTEKTDINNSPAKIAINEDGISIEEKEAEKLDTELNKNPSDSLFIKLDTLSCHSDADLSESIGVTMRNEFENHFNITFSYLYNNKKSCLFEALILELSEDLCIYEVVERKIEVGKLKNKKLKQARILKYSKEKIDYLTQLLNNINPHLFDAPSPDSLKN